jgi:hypothetical protein
MLIAQVKGWYIKGDGTKEYFAKFFFTYDLRKSGDLNIQQICSCDNHEYLLQSNSQVKILSNWYTILVFFVS